MGGSRGRFFDSCRSEMTPGKLHGSSAVLVRNHQAQSRLRKKVAAFSHRGCWRKRSPLDIRSESNLCTFDFLCSGMIDVVWISGALLLVFAAWLRHHELVSSLLPNSRQCIQAKTVPFK